jgi:hypothetical protein
MQEKQWAVDEGFRFIIKTMMRCALVKLNLYTTIYWDRRVLRVPHGGYKVSEGIRPRKFNG